MFPFVVCTGMALKGEACLAFGFDESSDVFIIVTEPILGLFLRKANCFLGSFCKSIAEGSPVILY